LTGNDLQEGNRGDCAKKRGEGTDSTKTEVTERPSRGTKKEYSGERKSRRGDNEILKKTTQNWKGGRTPREGGEKNTGRGTPGVHK